MHNNPTLECQDCGVVLRRLTVQEALQVAHNPYNYIVYCKSCAEQWEPADPYKVGPFG